MQTKSIIQASAQVIRITQLKKGDVYKRIEEQSYGDPKTMYGLVTDILNDGEKTFIEAIEYRKEWSDVHADFKVLGGDKDLSIFPASVDEIKEHFADCLQKIRNDIKDKEEKLAEKKHSLSVAESFASGELAKTLSVPDFKTQTQGEYLEEKRIRDEAIRSLTA